MSYIEKDLQYHGTYASAKCCFPVICWCLRDQRRYCHHTKSLKYGTPYKHWFSADPVDKVEGDEWAKGRDNRAGSINENAKISWFSSDTYTVLLLGNTCL